MAAAVGETNPLGSKETNLLNAKWLESELFYCPVSQSNIFGFHKIFDNSLLHVMLNGSCIYLRLQKNDISGHSVEKYEFNLKPSSEESSLSGFEVCSSSAFLLNSHLCFAYSLVVENVATSAGNVTPDGRLCIYSQENGEADGGAALCKALESPSNYQTFSLKFAPCFMQFYSVKDIIVPKQQSTADDVIMILSGSDKSISCYRMCCTRKSSVGDPTWKFQESVIDDVLPELSAQNKFTTTLTRFDAVILESELTRLSVGGFESGDLFIWKTDLNSDSGTTTAAFTVHNDVPISVAQFCFLSAVPPQNSGELVLIASSALGPLGYFSELDLIAGKFNAPTQTLGDSAKFDCLLCATICCSSCATIAADDYPTPRDILLIGTHGRVILIYQCNIGSFVLLGTLTMPAPIVGVQTFTTDNVYVGIATTLGLHVLSLCKS